MADVGYPRDDRFRSQQFPRFEISGAVAVGNDVNRRMS